MKVNLGPYPDAFIKTTGLVHKWFQFRYKKWDWEVEEKDYDRLDRIFIGAVKSIDAILDPINRIGYRRKRKQKVVIHPYDVWSADHTLALITLPILKMLRENKTGSVHVDPKDVPHIGKGKKTDFGHGDDKIPDRWNWVLDEMIWTFEQLVDEEEGRQHYYVPYKDGEKVHRVSFFKETEEQARARGRFDVKLYRQYQKRIDNGLRLFGKYYRGLWD